MCSRRYARSTHPLRQVSECASLKSRCPSFVGYHLYHPSSRQNSPAFQLLLEALRCGDLVEARWKAIEESDGAMFSHVFYRIRIRLRARVSPLLRNSKGYRIVLLILNRDDVTV